MDIQVCPGLSYRNCTASLTSALNNTITLITNDTLAVNKTAELWNPSKHQTMNDVLESVDIYGSTLALASSRLLVPWHRDSKKVHVEFDVVAKYDLKCDMWHDKHQMWHDKHLTCLFRLGNLMSRKGLCWHDLTKIFSFSWSNKVTSEIHMSLMLTDCVSGISQTLTR